ncbi:MAG: hypothetical protein WCG94_08025, partial [Methanothrix sp.]
MAIATLYIDSADEITSVIERIKSSHEPIVALVVPKGAILIQSIVNLKLARKATLDAEKDLILVTTDKIGRNLASQIGITVVTSEKEVSAAARGESTQDPPSEEAKVIAGVRIHRYYDQEPAPDQEIGPEVIVPKQLLSAKEAEPVAAPEPLKLERKQITSPPPLPSTALPAPHSPAAVDTNQPEPAVEVISTKSANTAPSPAKAKKRPKRLVIILGSLITVLLLVLVAVGVLIIPATKITLTLSSTPWS